ITILLACHISQSFKIQESKEGAEIKSADAESKGLSRKHLPFPLILSVKNPNKKIDTTEEGSPRE
ncbi:unnamed protein product, partial [Allacma fusca]